MTRLGRPPLSAAIHVGALLVGSAGFVTLVAAGAPDIPPIPPGAVLFLAVSAATVRWPEHRWPVLVGTSSCAVILVGAFGVFPGTVERLTEPGSVALFLGTVLQMGGVAAATVSGAVRLFSRRAVQVVGDEPGAGNTDGVGRVTGAGSCASASA